MPEILPNPVVSHSANVLFAFEPQKGQGAAQPFPDTRRLTLPVHGSEGIGIEVAGGSGAVVETFYDPTSGICGYLWGQVGHPDLPRADLLKWAVGKISSGDFTSLRQIVGVFVLLIDDRRNHRVRMVGDVMGLRPWFVGQYQGRLVCGSDVWAIHDAGLNAGGVNYDAVASWVRYIYDCTGQSLFADYSQLGYGAIGTWENGQYAESQYATYTGAQNIPPVGEVVENIHQRMSRTFEAQTKDLDHVQIALSGGYDSRYLAAMATRRKHIKAEAFNVRDREAEGVAATMVAEALGLPLKVLRIDGSLWNMFAEPFHFTPGGFPITKQLSYFAASQRPGVPCLNGFMGDPMFRGTMDRAEKKLEHETTEDPAVVFTRMQCLKHTLSRFDLLDPAVLRRCDERLVPVWRKELNRWQHTSHPFWGVICFVRQRHYMANNFLQHMDVAEAILPFPSWETIEYRLQNHATCYNWDMYETLLNTYFPEIAHVPHNSKMGEKNDLNPAPSRCTKQWASAVLKGLRRGNCLPLANRRKSVPRLIGAIMGRRDLDVAAMFLHRLFLLDQRLNRAGVKFDWYAI